MNLARIFQEKEIRDFISESWAVSAPMTLIMVFDFLIGIADIYVAGKIGKEIQPHTASWACLFRFHHHRQRPYDGNRLRHSRFQLRRQRRTRQGHILYDHRRYGGGFLFGNARSNSHPSGDKTWSISGKPQTAGDTLARSMPGGSSFIYILLNTNGILRSCKKVRLSLGTMA